MYHTNEPAARAGPLLDHSSNFDCHSTFASFARTRFVADSFHVCQAANISDSRSGFSPFWRAVSAGRLASHASVSRTVSASGRKVSPALTALWTLKLTNGSDS